MPHQKSNSHISFIEAISDKLKRCSLLKQDSFDTLKFQKPSSRYKKYVHKQYQPRQPISLFKRNQSKNLQKQENSSIVTQSPYQILVSINKKQERPAFYEQKYIEQINCLSSNLNIKQMQKQIPVHKHKKHQRKSTLDTHLNKNINVSIELRELRIPKLSYPLKNMPQKNIITMDQNCKLFKEKYLQKADKKLKFNTKLTPLSQIRNFPSSSPHKEPLSLQRQHNFHGQPNSNQTLELGVALQERASYIKNYKTSILDQLLDQQEINPWQNSMQDQEAIRNDFYIQN